MEKMRSGFHITTATTVQLYHFHDEIQTSDQSWMNYHHPSERPLSFWGVDVPTLFHTQRSRFKQRHQKIPSKSSGSSSAGTPLALQLRGWALSGPPARSTPEPPPAAKREELGQLGCAAHPACAELVDLACPLGALRSRRGGESF